MIFGLVVFISMLPMDFCAAAKVTYLETKRPWMAGHAEVISDWGGALSYGCGGAAIIRYGWSFTTVFILLCLGAASELGTVLGWRFTNKVVT